MDPHSDKVPGLGLPPPAMEQGASIPPAIAPLTSPAQGDPGVQDQAVSGQPGVPTMPNDDTSSDLDEEWVNKAKAIVEQTKNDPFLESKELGKIKADYLKTRYDKDIKVVEDHS